ncbi:MAG: sialidase family protein [Bacteroidota bacterium]|nr:sialidase family protein [Bacteroidota bacterium]
MFKQYFGIITLYFCVGLNLAQINTFAVISGPDIKTLGNSIQDRKNEGLIYHVLDSITKTPQAPNMAAADGKLYKSYIKNSALYFTRSSDGGKTWLPKDIFIDSIPKNKTNPFTKANQFAYTVCNKSMNRIYVCWSDAKNGIKNNDVYLTYSDDGGDTWLDRILVTYYPNHKQQFMPRFAIDHSTGYLYVMYANQRNFAKGNLTDVYLAVSRDNGTTFTEHKLNETAFEWKNNSSLEKYFSLIIHNGSIYPIWMQPDANPLAGKAGKKITIHATSINDAVLKNSMFIQKIVLDKTITHVYSARTQINFNENPGPYTAYIYKATNPSFELIVTPQIPIKAGSRSITVEFEKLKLSKGTYVLVVYNNLGANYVWIQEE